MRSRIAKIKEDKGTEKRKSDIKIESSNNKWGN